MAGIDTKQYLVEIKGAHHLAKKSEKLFQFEVKW